MVFGNGVKNIQATAYNGTHTVYKMSWQGNPGGSYNQKNEAASIMDKPLDKPLSHCKLLEVGQPALKCMGIGTQGNAKC